MTGISGRRSVFRLIPALMILLSLVGVRDVLADSAASTSASVWITEDQRSQRSRWARLPVRSAWTVGASEARSEWAVAPSPRSSLIMRSHREAA